MHGRKLICITAFICLIVLPGQAAEQSNVIHCETVEDIEAAKQAGAVYIEKSGYYFVQIGGEYKGPYRSLKTAKKLRGHFIQEAQKKGIISTGSKYAGTYNPRLIIDPFVKLDEDKQLMMQIPTDQWAKASTVMIHPEPLVFEEVKFGKLEVNKKGTFFAVTGKIAIKETIPLKPGSLDYHVGASVMGENGSILWQAYGTANKNMEFKCIAKMTPTTLPPAFLLLFTLGEGNLPNMLSAEEEIQPKDAAGYDYHVLCSAALEIGKDWFAPIEQMAKEEYEKMVGKMTKQKLEKIRGSKKGIH